MTQARVMANLYYVCCDTNPNSEGMMLPHLIFSLEHAATLRRHLYDCPQKASSERPTPPEDLTPVRAALTATR